MAPFILLIGLLLILSGFFSASETAIFSLSHVQLHHMKETKKRPARMLTEALKRPRQILITILLGNELVNVSISIVSAALIAHTLRVGPLAETVVSVGVATPLVLILGEIVPKNLALRFAPSYSQFAIVPLKVFSSLVRPLRYALTSVADWFIRMMGGTVSERPMIMEQEYRHLVDLGRREGVIIEEEREIIHSIFEFSDKVVSSIMTPAERIFMLAVDTPYDEMLTRLKERLYSRVPIFAGTRNNIIGILHLRDLFAFDHRRRAGAEEDIRSILIEALFVEPDEKLENLLHQFQKQRVHMAVVRKDRGPIEGVVTMDDVLEDLFGEIEE